jgi:hypothetical protein
MKKVMFSIALALVMVACGTTVKLPVSNVVPAAVITAKKKTDKNNNIEISVSASNLASPERLSPSRKIYVVWITTKESGIKNIGQLENKNAKKASLTTVSSFEPVEIFITAEDDGNATYPTGTEISRARF